MRIFKLPERLVLLDVSRTIASISVVVWHWQHFAYQGTNKINDFDKTSQPFYSTLSLFYERGGNAVEYFFLLSGFVFFWLYSDKIKSGITTTKKFWVARFARLYPLHFVSLLIVCILQCLFWLNEGDYFVYGFNNIKHFILNLFLVNHWGFQDGPSFNEPSWSVSIEILLYLIFFILAKQKALKLNNCIFISFSTFILARLLDNNPLFNGCSYFFIGGVCYFLTGSIFRNKLLSKLIVLVSMISWLLVFLNFYSTSFNSEFSRFFFFKFFRLSVFMEFILFPSTLLTLILLEVYILNLKNKSLIILSSSNMCNYQLNSAINKFTWIGDITYSSYLLHFPLQIIFGLLVSVNFLNHNFYMEKFYFCFFFFILIILSFIVNHKLEKPLQGIIRNFLDK
jgi:peptidoglycan/LPS O-acetylase OafA/YrhL